MNAEQAARAPVPPPRPPARTLTRDEYGRFLPMVRRIALKLARRVGAHVQPNDLISAGWVGLLEAFAREGNKLEGEEFEAYASHRVKGAMLDYLRTSDPAARQARNASRRVARACARLRSTLGREPTEAEIAASLGLKEAAYHETLSSLAQAGMARVDLADPEQIERTESGKDDPEEGAGRRQLSAALAGAVGRLPERLQQLLALYYQEECTFREIGLVLGVTESRACQLHAEAVHRLRAAIGKD